MYILLPGRKISRPATPRRITLPGAGACRLLISPLPNLEIALAKPPNYKQEKKRREDMQKKKNDAKQLEKAARKENVPRPLKP